MKVAFTIGTVSIPPTYFAWQHAIVADWESKLFSMVDDIRVSGIPVMGAVPGKKYLTFRQREYLQPLFFKRWESQIKSFSPDLIHHHHIRWTVPVHAAQKKLDIPMVVALHGGDILAQKVTPHTLMQKWHRYNFNISVKKANLLTPVSKFLADQAISVGVPVGKMEVVYQGIDTDFFVPLPQKPENELPIGIFVGSLAKHKGIKNLLQASVETYHSKPHRLRIVGDGPLRKLVEETAQKYPHIQLFSQQDRNGVRKLLQQSDFFVMASRIMETGWQEAAGLVSLEAQACGLPVVVTTSGGAAEMIIPDMTGLVAKANSASSLQEKISQMLSYSNEERMEMGKKAREFVVENRSTRKAVEQLDSLYHELIKKR